MASGVHTVAAHLAQDSSYCRSASAGASISVTIQQNATLASWSGWLSTVVFGGAEADRASIREDYSSRVASLCMLFALRVAVC